MKEYKAYNSKPFFIFLGPYRKSKNGESGWWVPYESRLVVRLASRTVDPLGTRHQSCDHLFCDRNRKRADTQNHAETFYHLGDGPDRRASHYDVRARGHIARWSVPSSEVGYCSDVRCGSNLGWSLG